ncbi:MAG: hypothetical protein KAI61_00880 [Alphaproteobacteria bacterium]|nr:hypothetical protein [Alphaproteobacteria bacterium]MCK5555513.1 hypothetical protein [Alphaproteobacteria bacterium]MCK5658458.1 hypothetical protein [Alphaproteobacteria bacterium]
MLNNKLTFLCLIISAALLGAVIFSTVVSARIPGLPCLDEDNLTVMNIPIVVEKKKGEDDEAARSVAIYEAHRKAFRKLAQESMTPEAFKIYEMPSDDTIIPLMREFEIGNVRSSPERYEAIFSVRFKTDILKYLNIKGGAGKSFPTR